MMKKGANQDQKNASFVSIDARKFLRTINESVGAKLAFFTNKIADMGKKTGKNLRLVALDKRHLFYEDIDTNTYFRANVSKEKNHYKIHDIKKIVVTEAEKGESFAQFCADLIESVDKGEMSKAESAFAKIESSRFRSTVVPVSGIVKTRDGNAHRINIAEARLSDTAKRDIITTIAEAIANNYNISEDGQVVSAYFSEEDQIKLPATERMRRTVVARNMRKVAMEAWKKDGFQKFIKTVAAHISKHNLKEAVDITAEFLREYQEFSVLDRESFETIIENALFANNIFNSILAENVQELVYKTNIKINKTAILESWEKTANKAQDAEWAQSVSLLKESESFSEDYDKFLRSVLNEFKDTDTTLMALKFARNAAAKEGDMADNQTVEKLDDLIARLERTETEDQAAHEEAQELLAGISYDLLDRSESLGDFDEIPAPGAEDELVAPEGAVEDLGGGDDLGGGGLDDLDIGAESDATGGDDLGLDAAATGGDDLGMDLGGDEGLDAGGGDDLADASAEDPMAMSDEDDDELSFEEKKKAVVGLQKLYEKYNKQFGKVLKEEGPAGMMAGVDQALAKAKTIGALAAEVEAKFMELKAELGGSGLMPDAMTTGSDLDVGLDAPAGDEYGVGAPATEVDVATDYMGPDSSADVSMDMDIGGTDDVSLDGEADAGSPPSFGGESDDADKSDDEDDSEDEGEGDSEDDGDSDGPPSPPTPPKADSDKSDDKEDDKDDDELEEDQYKWGTRRHGQGDRSGYGRSSINAVEESVVSNDKYAMAIAEDDGNFWLYDKSLSEATCVGDGIGQFDFDLTDDQSYIRAAKVWMEGIINSDNLVKTYWEKAVSEAKKSWEKPWEKKDGKDAKSDKPKIGGDSAQAAKMRAKADAESDFKKDSGEVEETHTTGMHGKSDSAEKMTSEVEEDATGTGAAAVGVDKSKEKDEMCESACPNCGSGDIVVNESVGEATCGGCGVVGKTELFNKTVEEAVTDKGSSQKGMVDPKDATYKTDKDARKWGDGSNRNKKPTVKQDDDEGSKGSKEAPKSKTPEKAKGDDMKTTKPGKSDMFKQ